MNVVDITDLLKSPMDRAGERLLEAIDGLSADDAASLLVFAAGEIVANNVEAEHRPVYLTRLTSLMYDAANSALD